MAWGLHGSPFAFLYTQMDTHMCLPPHEMVSTMYSSPTRNSCNARALFIAPVELTLPIMPAWAARMSSSHLQKKMASLPAPAVGFATSGHWPRSVAQSTSSTMSPDLNCSAAGTPFLRKASCISALSLRASKRSKLFVAVKPMASDNRFANSTPGSEPGSTPNTSYGNARTACTSCGMPRYISSNSMNSAQNVMFASCDLRNCFPIILDDRTAMMATPRLSRSKSRYFPEEYGSTTTAAGNLR
mmetsp:Transcript_74100/g.205926  ORF Transcript_74100/g.205926 Transcript_74100/m.205926 type:complete len:243 (+) Transcript_74100:749-1477(+)